MKKWMNLWRLSRQSMQSHPKRWLLALGIVVLLTASLLIVGYWTAHRGESVASFKAKVVRAFEEDLGKPTNALRQKVEAAHVTVTSTGGQVYDCVVKTKDGSNNAGVKGSNVREFDIFIRVFWDGHLQKNGHTDLEMVYNCEEGKVVTVQYVGGNALFNMETIDWYGVGQKAGAAAAAIFFSL